MCVWLCVVRGCVGSGEVSVAELSFAPHRRTSCGWQRCGTSLGGEFCIHHDFPQLTEESGDVYRKPPRGKEGGLHECRYAGSHLRKVRSCGSRRRAAPQQDMFSHKLLSQKASRVSLKSGPAEAAVPCAMTCTETVCTRKSGSERCARSKCTAASGRAPRTRGDRCAAIRDDIAVAGALATLEGRGAPVCWSRRAPSAPPRREERRRASWRPPSAPRAETRRKGEGIRGLAFVESAQSVPQVKTRRQAEKRGLERRRGAQGGIEATCPRTGV